MAQAANQFYQIPAALQQLFVDKDTQAFLAGGIVSFFEDNDRTTGKPVYQLAGTPGNYTYVPYGVMTSEGWQVTLNMSGSFDFALYYYPYDDEGNFDPYYITWASADGVPQGVRENWPADGVGGGGGTGSGEATNFITNGGFQNPINFNLPEQEAGKIYTTDTEVATAWYISYYQSGEVNITFTPAFQQDLADNPQNFINFTFSDTGCPSVALEQNIGYVNMLQGENVTLSLSGNTLSGTSAVLSVVWVQVYGNGTPDIMTTLGTITLPISDVPASQFLQFTVPPLPAELPIDLINNGAYLAIFAPAATLTSFQYTQPRLQQGFITDPTYAEEPIDIVTARAFAHDFNVPTNLFNQDYGYANYTKCTYINNQYTWVSNTGSYKAVTVSALPPDMLFCDAQSLDPTDFVNGIPLMRLFDKIGTEFGGTADIIASTAGTATITAGSPTGARELSAWAAGNSGFTVTQTEIGLKLGISAAFTTGSTTSVDVTWLDQFVVQQQPGFAAIPPFIPQAIPNGVIGNWSSVEYFGTNVFTTTTLTPGSVSTYASARIAFNSTNIATYSTSYGSHTIPTINYLVYGALNCLEFASLASNTRGTYFYRASPMTPLTYSAVCILFTVDGAMDNRLPSMGNQYTVTVPFLSTQSLTQNVQTFIDLINNPFQYTVTIPALPAASQYFLFSSSTTNYYAWFTIDGVGVDPTPGGTGRLCALLSTDTPITAGQKIATIMSSASFSLPSQADLVALGNPLIKWAVYL